MQFFWVPLRNSRSRGQPCGRGQVKFILNDMGIISVKSFTIVYKICPYPGHLDSSVIPYIKCPGIFPKSAWRNWLKQCFSYACMQSFQFYHLVSQTQATVFVSRLNELTYAIDLLRSNWIWTQKCWNFDSLRLLNYLISLLRSSEFKIDKQWLI